MLPDYALMQFARSQQRELIDEARRAGLRQQARAGRKPPKPVNSGISRRLAAWFGQTSAQTAKQANALKQRVESPAA